MNTRFIVACATFLLFAGTIMAQAPVKLEQPTRNAPTFTQNVVSQVTEYVQSSLTYVQPAVEMIATNKTDKAGNQVMVPANIEEIQRSQTVERLAKGKGNRLAADHELAPAVTARKAQIQVQRKLQSDLKSQKEKSLKAE